MYLVHRWVALVVGLQLFVWSVSGFIFSMLNIDDVHGDLDRTKLPPASLAIADVVMTPAQAIDALVKDGVDAGEIASVDLRQRIEVPVYVVRFTKKAARMVVDARTGLIVPFISEKVAQTIALDDFKHDAEVASVELLEGKPPGEFRGGPMPVYRVILDHEKHTHIYISPTTGDILKRRNEKWRWFDFFWMLHIMDYEERDNINHWLLIGASALAIVTSATGLALWWYRIPWRKRRGRVTT
jgi:uncharacterized membrane protein YkoI